MNYLTVLIVLVLIQPILGFLNLFVYERDGHILNLIAGILAFVVFFYYGGKLLLNYLNGEL